MKGYSNQNHIWHTWVCEKVIKISKKPFKSGSKVATVNGTVIHPITSRLSFVFIEDDSFVECNKVELWK
jgi:hypothetical protein